jgi:hypothetical protein
MFLCNYFHVLTLKYVYSCIVFITPVINTIIIRVFLHCIYYTCNKYNNNTCIPALYLLQNLELFVCVHWIGHESDIDNLGFDANDTELELFVCT